MATLNEKLVGIPIGLENSQWKGFNYNFLKKYKLSEKQNLLYINFNINTNKKREDIINLFKSKNFDINPRLEWNDYIKEMSTYKYVLSPSGCGEDCHRIWESLYLGCIPIVLKTDVLYTYFNNLPIYFVDNYDSITQNHLDEIYNTFSFSNIEMLTLEYWKNDIIRTLL